MAAVVLALFVAGCGARTSAAPLPHATVEPAAATPSPQPSPSPVPPPELVVSAPNGALGAVSADGTWLWSFQPSSLHLTNPSFQVAGPHLLATDQAGAVVVIDRAGHIVGRGSLTHAPNTPNYPQPSADPGGTRWAWSTVDMGDVSSTTAQFVSTLWTAGLDQAPRRLKTWTEPNQTEIDVIQWSDAGIVLLKIASGCGGQALSSSILDPATGAETPLFGADVFPADVHAGVETGVNRSQNTVVIAGAASYSFKYSLPVHEVRVNPSGTRVEVSTFGEQGCGGVWKAETDVIDVAGGSQVALPGFFADAWLDDAHLVGRTAVAPANPQQGGGSWSAHAQLADLDGHVTDLVLGVVLGVLRG